MDTSASLSSCRVEGCHATISTSGPYGLLTGGSSGCCFCHFCLTGRAVGKGSGPATPAVSILTAAVAAAFGAAAAGLAAVDARPGDPPLLLLLMPLRICPAVAPLLVCRELATLGTCRRRPGPIADGGRWPADEVEELFCTTPLENLFPLLFLVDQKPFLYLISSAAPPRTICSEVPVRYHCGGRPTEVNACFLNLYMVYL
jgi:hypothetical protein